VRCDYVVAVVVVVSVSVSVDVVEATVVVVVVARLKPHFLPLLFGFGFIGFFFALWSLHGLLWLFGTPPLSAELRTGNAPAIPRHATKTASLRVLSFTS
jgi:hypothetical protein